MLLNPRAWPVLLFGILLVIKSIWHGFLSIPVWAPLAWVTWWGVTIFLVSIVAAFCIAPAIMGGLLWIAGTGFFPVVLVLAFFFGLLVAADITWNYGAHALWPTAPHADLVNFVTSLIFGSI